MNLRISIWALLLVILSLQVLTLTASSSNNKNVNKRSTTKRLVREQPLLKRSIRSIDKRKEEETVEEDDEDKDENDDEASTNINNNTDSSSSDCPIILPPNYNKLEIPRGTLDETGDPDNRVEVYLNLNIRSIVDINENQDEITLDLDMILLWGDAVLQFDILKRCPEVDPEDDPRITFDPVFLNQLWKPDIFIENTVSVKQNDLMRKPTRLEIAVDGLVVLTKRMTIKIACGFNFQYYPADTQECNVVLRSYAYTNKELTLQWYTNGGVYLPDVNNDNFYIAIDSLKRYNLKPKLLQNSFHTLEDTFDALQFTLRIRRKLSYHIVQTYIPTMLYIAITWLCFMVPKSMIEARLAIVMTTLLTLTAMFASIRESTPAVSYVKAIDIWMLAGISFVFAVLLEFALILWTETEKRQAELDKLDLARGSQIASTNTKDCDNDHPDFKPASKTTSPSFVKRLRRNIIDKVDVLIGFIEAYSFILIFVIFLLFNTIYWTWLFYMSGYFNWSVNVFYNGFVGEDDDRSQQIIEELKPLFFRYNHDYFKLKRRA